MKRNANEMLEIVKAFVGDRTDDDALNLIEDVKDSMTSDTDTEQEDWKTKYEELDKSWREKYKARFFSGEESPVKNEVVPNDTKDEPEDIDNVTLKDLFEGGKIDG